MTDDILGRGLAFPLRVDPQRRLAMSAGEQRIRESIVTILGTEQGERLMRPDFGSRLRTLIFEPNNPATANLARFYIEDALARWEPRIEQVQVVVDPPSEGGAALNLRILYRIKATGANQSLEFTLPLEG
jgi:phage baseplate assembly protein W